MTKKQTVRAFADMKEAARKAAKALAAISRKYDPERSRRTTSFLELMKLSEETKESLRRIRVLSDKLSRKDSELSPEERAKLRAELDKLLAEPVKYEL